MKRIVMAAALALLVAGGAQAADGKVVSVADGAVVVEMAGGAGFKSGAKVKLNGKAGTVTAVEGARLTIKAAAQLKVGDAVKVDKAPALQGC